MAKISFPGQEEFGEKLRQLEEAFGSDEPLERAVAKGAKPVADEIRARLSGLPTEKYRRLYGDDKFSPMAEHEKGDLLAAFGLAPVKNDRGYIHTKAGFDGYGSHPTRQYPQGVPNQLVAASVESGSSVRQKHPFVRPAVNATKDEAIRQMENSIDEDLKKIF